VLVTGHNFVQARSGLVVPARIGEQTKIAVPNGNYSVTAFGGKRESLFATPDPYRVVAGNTTLLNGNRQLALYLVPREPLLKAFPQPSITLSLKRPPTNRNVPASSQQRCPLCRQAPSTNLLAYMQVCPSVPKPDLWWRCDRCSTSFSNPEHLRGHVAHNHPWVDFWRSLTPW